MIRRYNNQTVNAAMLKNQHFMLRVTFRNSPLRAWCAFFSRLLLSLLTCGLPSILQPTYTLYHGTCSYHYRCICVGMDSFVS